MKFTIGTVLIALGSLASAATAPEMDYELKDFTEQRNGDKITGVSFTLKSINGGGVEFKCSPYDPATDKDTTDFHTDTVYFCAKNSPVSFNYKTKTGDGGKNQLFVWQKVDVERSLLGKVEFDAPICHASGSGKNGQFCTLPPQTGAWIIHLANP